MLATSWLVYAKYNCYLVVNLTSETALIGSWDPQGGNKLNIKLQNMCDWKLAETCTGGDLWFACWFNIIQCNIMIGYKKYHIIITKEKLTVGSWQWRWLQVIVVN